MIREKLKDQLISIKGTSAGCFGEILVFTCTEKKAKGMSRQPCASAEEAVHLTQWVTNPASLRSLKRQGKDSHGAPGESLPRPKPRFNVNGSDFGLPQ